jgi:general L-amino acid transport system permease protein
VRGLYVPAASGQWWDIISGATIALVVLAGLLWRRIGDPTPRLLVLPPVLILGMVAAGLHGELGSAGAEGVQFRRRGAGAARRCWRSCWACRSTPRPSSPMCRAAILGIHPGQNEAARGRWGCTGGQTMTLVILPQAMRILIPPLTRPAVFNIIKSTTLGAAIAYPEILQIMGRTVLNQSGRAIEVMSIILATFLSVNLVTSLLMNRWNRKLALQGR